MLSPNCIVFIINIGFIEGLPLFSGFGFESYERAGASLQPDDDRMGSHPAAGFPGCFQASYPLLKLIILR